ncbi:MAG TPA: TM2 domain-containing protein [Bacteroidia bacterium]|nr:TM2 domain-containing protein [Bacteroidia bacterium]
MQFRFLLVALLFCSAVFANEKQPVRVPCIILHDTLVIDTSAIGVSRDTMQVKATAKRAANDRFIAAVLAFPVPFGILGLHRIYLGTAPYVPVVYIVTAGGFGLLPLLDFIAIVSASDEEFESFHGNPNVFMWVK